MQSSRKLLDYGEDALAGTSDYRRQYSREATGERD
jgi:hypothetical protein